MSLPRLRIVLLALALLAAQSLALLHGFVHLPGQGPAAGLPVQASAAVLPVASAGACGLSSDHVSTAVHGAGSARTIQARGLAALFGTHADDADCRLLDQLADASPVLNTLTLAVLPVAGIWTARWRDAALRILRPAPPGRGPPAIA